MLGNMYLNLIARAIILSLVLILGGVSSFAQQDTSAIEASVGSPVVFSGDTLFFVRANLGPFTKEQRALGISEKLQKIFDTGMKADLIRTVEGSGMTAVLLDSLVIMAVTDEDASYAGKTRSELATELVATFQTAIKDAEEKYGIRNLLISTGFAVLLLIAALLAFWLMRKTFPKVYAKLEGWEGKVFRPIKFRSYEVLSAAGLTAFFVVLLKGIRLALSLTIIYYLIVYVFSLFPWTKSWDVTPILKGILLSILLTVTAIVLVRSVTKFFVTLINKVSKWKGTLIKSVRLRTVEVLSEERIAEIIQGALKLINLVALLALGYFYITILFSFFDFTRTWASTLIGYILKPLGNILLAFINYLPNVFFIVVIIFVTRYVLKFIRLIFNEIQKGAITLPGFFPEWAETSYKIVRFLVIAFAVIVIFPYLPGSDSPIFQGISVFLGVLFSLGSTSAIANIVAGIVLTYMRPFKIGDRVKIADTIGDVVEKNLLVTRVRTIKNVDITIPNSMVLGSHIINFSSVAKKTGLILHTSVTIGYDVPWKKVHELLVAAAESTEHLLNDPKPFVLQTSLDDSYVSYEVNAYTDQPNVMAKTYSELHQNIQDKFNEAGVEIMSPHYSAVRDGNQMAIPENYLPKPYSAPAFRIFPFGDVFKKPGDKKE